MGRFLRFLAELPEPPETAAHLTAIQLDSYLRSRIRIRHGRQGFTDFLDLRRLLQEPPLRESISPALENYLNQRTMSSRHPSLPGYSDGEFTRIVKAARQDVAMIRSRIDAGEQLLVDWHTDPTSLDEPEADLAKVLAAVAETGVVPRLGGLNERSRRTELARRLFVTQLDRRPLLVLLVAVTGRNAESLKELTHEHRIIDGKAVEVRMVKRRHGRQQWHDTVTWEIGPAHRELHTPGGLYLLLHRLMARSRAFSHSGSIWSTWRNSGSAAGIGPAEHHDTYARRLSVSLDLKGWGAHHGLCEDTRDGEEPAPLAVDLRRIRTTCEVRRTRELGGHLPSAARSNTMGVLFASYLRGDPSTRDWAEAVVSQAMSDAEGAALAAHRQALASTGAEGLRVNPEPAPASPEMPAQEGAWNVCADPEQHPTTGRPCRRVSYLDCFHCANCVITRHHLPAIVALHDDLADRRQHLGESEWWTRYGRAWAAIRHDVYTKFTPAEVSAANASTPVAALLELAEDPWERP
ncbi:MULTISPECIES: hypothetical protein [unclassified Mycolicibacterium]|uniref:hypothetical protein n=1 Tax=unclassified Mycolicibacterium TaxID=2636767 RepID=UPI002ED9C124